LIYRGRHGDPSLSKPGGSARVVPTLLPKTIVSKVFLVIQVIIAVAIASVNYTRKYKFQRHNFGNFSRLFWELNPLSAVG
jgi:hypothetical protein